DRGADAEALQRLTTAVERANYARPGAQGTDDLAEPLRAVLSSLQHSVDGPTRVRARLLPRSLYAPRGADAALLA
ncbi:hypothetical protein, partial [Microbacterium sp. K41]